MEMALGWLEGRGWRRKNWRSRSWRRRRQQICQAFCTVSVWRRTNNKWCWGRGASVGSLPGMRAVDSIVCASLVIIIPFSRRRCVCGVVKKAHPYLKSLAVFRRVPSDFWPSVKTNGRRPKWSTGGSVFVKSPRSLPPSSQYAKT